MIGVGRSNILKRALRPVVDLAYPPRCPVCGTALGSQDGLCLDCWNSLAIPQGNHCRLCQRPASDAALAVGNALCASCMADPPSHEGTVSATYYDETSRKIVLAFKHGNRIALATMMARLMASQVGAIPDDTLVVPVPLHRWRLWRRGYNQSALLARELTRMAGGRLLVDGLERVRPTPSLGGLGRQERARVLHGAIRTRYSRAQQIAGNRILLVDDVLTSGATANACTHALLESGAHAVRIACFARVASFPETASRP